MIYPYINLLQIEIINATVPVLSLPDKCWAVIDRWRKKHMEDNEEEPPLKELFDAFKSNGRADIAVKTILPKAKEIYSKM